MSPEQWAKVPEGVAYMGLDAVALDVLIVLASKAGRDRTAWITQQAMGDRLGVGRTTIADAIRRLEKHDLVRKAGRVVVDHERGTWVQRYKVAPYLPVVGPRPTSGSPGTEGPDVGLEGPDVGLGLPDVGLGGPDAGLGDPMPRTRHERRHIQSRNGRRATMFGLEKKRGPTQPFTHADDCRILKADPATQIEWVEVSAGHWEAVCACGHEFFHEPLTDNRERLDPYDPSTFRHAGQCEHRDTSDTALLRAILKVRDGAGGGYWWVECATCEHGWQVPHYPRPPMRLMPPPK